MTENENETSGADPWETELKRAKDSSELWAKLNAPDEGWTFPQRALFLTQFMGDRTPTAIREAARDAIDDISENPPDGTRAELLDLARDHATEKHVGALKDIVEWLWLLPWEGRRAAMAELVPAFRGIAASMPVKAPTDTETVEFPV